MNTSKQFPLMVALFIIMMGYGCKDMGVPVRTEPQLFDIEYWFVNQGDPDIRAVEVLSVTWYPDRNEAWARQTNFQVPQNYDTLRQVAYYKGVLGCTTQMGIYINKFWDQDSTPCWRFYYFSGHDSVDSYEKRIRVFKWPEDTLRAIHEYVDRIGFCSPE